MANSSAYEAAYRSLNPEQKKAVDYLDGPVLVVAGPGTGKTQLLTTRIGRILDKTDASPENILCLTFSESAVKAMKNRLASLIGPAAHNVVVSTYHSFGSELIRANADLFNLAPDIQPADEILLDKLLRKVQSELDFSNPLKDEIFLSDIKSLISGYKRALITPEKIEEVCFANEAFIELASELTNSIINPNERLSKKQIPLFERLLHESEDLTEKEVKDITSLKQLWIEQLSRAVELASSEGKTAPLSQWKKDWLEKDHDNRFIVKSARINRRQRALAEIFKNYIRELKKQSLFDYDDMIMLAIEGLQSNPEIKYTLQERYLYLQLDEFQDTNEAQLKLVELLVDNPVNEGSPNILAVGDDDQAIYSFQGAHYSHMERFKSSYKNVEVIALKTNYRSSKGIISFSSAIRSQIKEGLTITSKEQVTSDPSATEELLRAELPLDVEQLAYAAEYISELIKAGCDANDIAVLAPKHQLLIDFIPYLHAKNVAVNYEQRDNVLKDANIEQLITSARLINSIGQDDGLADAFWPMVLSQAHWQLPTSAIWRLSLEAHNNHRRWTELMLQDTTLRPLALFFIKLSQIAPDTPFETMLNYLIGSIELELNEKDIKTYRSPYFDYHFISLKEQSENIIANEWHLLGHLSILRARAVSSSESSLNLEQFLSLIDDYINAGIKIIDSSPFRESFNAVNLMTAYAAKGQEFDTVVLIDTVDKQWGKTARRQSNRISLPLNLSHVKLDLSSDDEKLRLLFVAASRAKRRLVMTSYVQSLEGKPAEHLVYLNEHMHNGTLVSPLLPEGKQEVRLPKVSELKIDSRLPSWYDRHLDGLNPKRRSLLADRLSNLALTATNLNNFTNVIDGGPVHFYLDEILRFPKVQTPRSQYGSAMHAVLDWQFKQTLSSGKQPPIDKVLKQFELLLAQKRLLSSDFEQYLKKGKHSLKSYFEQVNFSPNQNDLSEEPFASVLKDARIKGMVDRLLVNTEAKTVRIIDFKTGKTYERWNNEAKPFHHKRQLYFYKLLVELSPKFKHYTVEGATLQFVEPNDDDGLIHSLDLIFNEAESERLKLLIDAVWNKINALDFPDTTSFSADTKGILAFEDSLLNLKPNKKLSADFADS